MFDSVSKERAKQLIAFIALNIFALYLAWLLREFIAPFLGALIFYVLFRQMMEKLVKKGWRSGLAASIIIILSFIIILIPILSLSYLLYSKIVDAITNPQSVFSIIKMLDNKIYTITGVKILSDNVMDNIRINAGNLISSFVEQFFYVIGNIALMYFMLYYMLINGKILEEEVRNYLPFEGENIRMLSNELESQVRSNSVGVPLIALIQGTAAAIGYWIFGVDQPVFWGAITAFCSLFPLVGTAFVWLPATILLLLSGNTWQGIGLLMYGSLVVINIDNASRIFIQKKFADVHPLISVFGIIIGLELFGLPGLIFGPLMISYFLLLVKMYRRVYKSSEELLE